MSALHKAYQVLGLDVGGSFELVKRRYKRLVTVWHPDRMTHDVGRHEAEEELKKINNAFDVLKKHFEGHHKAGSACDCQSKSGTSTAGQRASGGPCQQSTNSSSTDEQRRKEQEADRREEQRRRQAEDEARQAEAAQKAEETRRTGDTTKQSTEQAMRREQALKDEQIRWQAAQAAAMAFLLIVAFGWLGVATRTAVVGIQQQWQPYTK